MTWGLPGDCRSRRLRGRPADRRADHRLRPRDRTPLASAKLVEREFGGFVPPSRYA